MKKNYLYVLTALLFTANIFAQTTETFETETTGSKTFTDNGQVFTITTQRGGSFSIANYTNSGYNGTAADNKFIDNSGTADFGAPVEFTISSGNAAFNLKSLYLYLSTVQLGNPTGSCTITGKLNNITVFTASKSNGFIDPVNSVTNNGYTQIDLATYGTEDYSNLPIDEFVISTTDKFEYVALDAMTWKIDCSLLLAPTVTSPQAFCDAGKISDLTASGSDLKWYADNSTNTQLAAKTALTSQTYYVSQTNGLCESPRKAVAVTVTSSTSNTTTIDACGEYTWIENNAKYTESGTYISIKGCDTQTLVLTIIPKTAKMIVVSECDEYTWTENNTKYTESGTYTSVKGCDTQTLVLTIVPKTGKTTVVSECGEYTWAENNTKYTESGTYISVKGCDTQTLALTIIPKTVNTTTIAACDSYLWPVDGNTYSVSGSYTGTTTNCITEVLNLTISSIDKSLKFENGILYSNAQNATYQWIDCPTNTAIPGATSLKFTPVVNGTYSVLISLGSCSVTSDCFAITTLGRDQFNFESGLKVYPNPSHDVFNITIESNAKVEIFDISGKKLKTQTISQGNSKLDASSFSAGMYVLKITNENNQTKIVKVTKN